MTLFERNARAEAGGGHQRVETQHAQGKLTARERIDALLDAGTFVEVDKLRGPQGEVQNAPTAAGAIPPGDGVVTGYGRVYGRQVFVYKQDFTVLGGSVSTTHAEKICKVMDLATQVGAPIIGLADSGGARIQDGVASLGGYGEIFYRNTRASGVVPQISCVMGPCAGGAVYSPALTDFIFMVQDTSHMFTTGPDVLRAVTQTQVTKDALGGAKAHSEVSGMAHFVAPDDASCLDQVRRLLTYLPGNNAEDPPFTELQDDPQRRVPQLGAMVSQAAHKPYDMHAAIRTLVDLGSFFEVQARFAKNIVVGFARLGGRVVGIVANQPQHLAGCLDTDAAQKAARFVRFCDCFNIALVTLVDVPGFLPGIEQEARGIIRQGAKLMYAFAEASVPKVTVILRKAYGGAYDVMASKHLRADVNLALPTAEIAVMGPEAAVEITDREAIAQAQDPAQMRQYLAGVYKQTFATPYQAAALGFIDEVIEPELVRVRLAQSLDMLRDKRQNHPPRKHGNIPL